MYKNGWTLANGLRIDYQAGYGHKLPFAGETFDVVACCDTLEHIENRDAVIGEIARVLKTDSVFLFDTINRTIRKRISPLEGSDMTGFYMGYATKA